MRAEIRPMLDEPLHAALEPWQAIDDLRRQHLPGEQGDQPDHRSTAASVRPRWDRREPRWAPGTAKAVGRGAQLAQSPPLLLTGLRSYASIWSQVQFLPFPGGTGERGAAWTMT